MKVSLGLLEVKGLALAINTADAMAKCAAITIVEIEKTHGFGWMLIKIIGDVASVQAAIATGSQLAQQHQGLISQKVIARPDTKLLKCFLPTPKSPVTLEAEQQEVKPVQAEAAPTISKPKKIEGSETEHSEVSQTSSDVSCNLCLDPLCPRKKGEPHSVCINGGKTK